MNAGISTDTVTNGHRQTFGHGATLVAHAPGRVNLIGEHVDYNAGLVLPLAIQKRIIVAAGPGQPGQVRLYSQSLAAETSFSVDVAEPTTDEPWQNYVRGMVAGLREAGVPTAGATLWIGGDLLPGGGLSSSAALCVATGMALCGLAGKTVEPLALARLAQTAEHKFTGMPCGLMDQYAACFGRQDHALLMDCRSVAHEEIPMKLEGVCLAVIPSGVKHALVDGAYKKRVISCQAAIEIIRKTHPDVATLRDVTPDILASCAAALSETELKRTRHVVSEINRVQQAANALRQSDWVGLGKLLWQTQDSLRDDYEISCVEVDELVELLHAQDAVLGARMVGGGFGGVLLAIIREEGLADVTDVVRQEYYAPHGLDEDIFTVKPSAGAGII